MLLFCACLVRVMCARVSVLCVSYACLVSLLVMCHVFCICLVRVVSERCECVVVCVPRTCIVSCACRVCVLCHGRVHVSRVLRLVLVLCVRHVRVCLSDNFLLPMFYQILHHTAHRKNHGFTVMICFAITEKLKNKLNFCEPPSNPNFLSTMLTRQHLK
jgi:hypothetical protein